VFVSRIEDGRAITSALVVTLTVHRSRIMNLKEKLEEPSITELARVKNDFDSFGVGSVIPIRRIGERAMLAGGCFWGMQDLLRRYPAAGFL
jgi:hypothetical protein